MLGAEDIRKKLDTTWLKNLSDAYGIKEILLFGSILSDAFHEESDVDIAVLGDEKFKLTELLNMELALEDLLQRKIDVIDLKDCKMDIFFKIHILDTGLCIYTSDEQVALWALIEEVEAYYRKNKDYFMRRRRDVLC